MTISPFFQDLRTAYQSELEDLSFDSEGRDVLRQRLADKRQEMGFLVKMMELSPEMVAVVFHQGFEFKLPAMMDHLLSHEADEFPDWNSLAEAAVMAPWARQLAQTVLQEPGGEWFLTVAAGLEYMASRVTPAVSASGDTDNGHGDGDGDSDSNDERDEFDLDEEGEDHGDGKSRKEAGDDWMAEQGFDRKD